jgi:hypothetical protein
VSLLKLTGVGSAQEYCMPHDTTSQPKVKISDARRAKRPLLDYPFIPKPIALLHDARVSHLAYRLWDAIYDLQWRHIPPTMARLQAAIQCDGQPATRRSVERWLTELEHTGWLEWRRRASITERYQLKTGVITDAEGSVQDRIQAILRTGVSVEDLRATLDAILESHHTTLGSHNTTLGSHHATPGSDHVIAESHDTTPGSHTTIIERSSDHDQTPTDPMPAPPL